MPRGPHVKIDNGAYFPCTGGGGGGEGEAMSAKPHATQCSWVLPSIFQKRKKKGKQKIYKKRI